MKYFLINGLFDYLASIKEEKTKVGIKELSDIEAVVGLSKNTTYKLPITLEGSGSLPQQVEIVGSNKDIAVEFPSGNKTWTNKELVPDYIIIKTKDYRGITSIVIRNTFSETIKQVTYSFCVCFAPLKTEPHIDNKNPAIDITSKVEPISFAVEERSMTVYPSDDTLKKAIQATRGYGYTLASVKEMDEYRLRHLFNDASLPLTLETVSMSTRNIAIYPNEAPYQIGKTFYYDDTTFYLAKTDAQKVMYYSNGKTESIAKDRGNASMVFLVSSKQDGEIDKYNFVKNIVRDNELKLIGQPFISGLNVYWYQIEDAVSYLVEVFKSFNTTSVQGNQKNRTLAKYYDDVVYIDGGVMHRIDETRIIMTEDVERDRGYFSLNNLASGSYLVRVSAISKTGEVIAKTYPVAITVKGS